MLKKHLIFAVFLLCLPLCIVCSEKPKEKLQKIMGEKEEEERPKSPIYYIFCNGRAIRIPSTGDEENQEYNNGKYPI